MIKTRTTADSLARLGSATWQRSKCGRCPDLQISADVGSSSHLVALSDLGLESCHTPLQGCSIALERRVFGTKGSVLSLDGLISSTGGGYGRVERKGGE